MAINNLRKELVEIALKEKPENKIAKILAFYFPSLNLSDKKNFFESLLYYYKISDKFDFTNIIKEFDADNTVNSYVGKDFRIKSVEISNLRGIPEKDENGIPFGMNFYQNDIINNSIILANNGIGKSSIFAGLEMIYAQEIGEKRLRTKNNDKLNKSDYDQSFCR